MFGTVPIYALYTPITEPELDITNLPEGWTVEYKGMGWKSEEKVYYMAVEQDHCIGRCGVDSDLVNKLFTQGDLDCHYWQLHPPKPKPTTPEDLFPKGESDCWLCSPDKQVSYRVELVEATGRIGCYEFDNLLTMEELSDRNLRYSNHPLTPYEEANPFIV